MAKTTTVTIAMVILIVLVAGLLFYYPGQPVSSSDPNSSCGAGLFVQSEASGNLGCSAPTANSIYFQKIIAVTLQTGTSTTVSLPITEPNANYGVVCTTNFLTSFSVTNKGTSSFQITYPSIIITQTADCIVFR